MYAIRSYYAISKEAQDQQGKEQQTEAAQGVDQHELVPIGPFEGETTHGGDLHLVRITSYNVCYTKLLRVSSKDDLTIT